MSSPTRSDAAIESVFKALADPTRRAILDRLRHGPVTTGGLVEPFDMSRYGVMKHLKVLEEAGLVVVRREGRERFNHLNAVPLRRVYERWVRRFAGQDAAGLLALAEVAERGERSETMTEETKTPLSFEIQQEVRIAAPKEKVWKALTEEVGAWWAFHTEEFETEIMLDARIGGHMLESFGDEGEGFIWGTITYLRRNEKLRLRGSLGSKFNAHSQYTYTLSEDDAGMTTLALEHLALGHDDPATRERYVEGWQVLLGRNLKAWVEEGRGWQAHA